MSKIVSSHRHICIICDKSCKSTRSRRSSVVPQRLGLMLALLVHRGKIDVEKFKTVFQSCTQTAKGKFLCESHFVETAALLVGELSAGMSDVVEIELHLDMCMTFNSGAIPLELLDRLQQYMKMLDGNLVLDEKEIVRLLSEGASRYGLRSLMEKAGVMVSFKRKGEHDEQVSDGNRNGSQMAKRYHTLWSRSMNPFNIASASHLSGNRIARTGATVISESTAISSSIASHEQADSSDWNQNFIVDGNQLKQLFQFCPCCGTPLSGSSLHLKVVGTTPCVAIDCSECRRSAEQGIVWTGQKQTVEHPRSRTFAGNTGAAISAITSGVSFAALSRFAREMNTAFISKTAFCKIIEDLRPAIAKVYDLHQANVIETVKSAYREDGLHDGWDIAVEGAYDGDLHEFYKVLAVDLKTNLCIHTEVVHSYETEGIRDHMEKKGLRRLLLWFADLDIRIRSVTSGYHADFKHVIHELNGTLSWDMEWYLHHRHLSGFLVKELQEASKAHVPLLNWIEPLKTHLKFAAGVGLRAGGGKNIKFFFNTYLYHIAGIHSWKKDVLTGPYISCVHEVLRCDQSQPIPFGTPAYEKFKEIVLHERFQNDLCRLSPYGDITQCKKKHSLDRVYCPKEVYLSALNYSAYMVLSALHLNTLELAEMAEERKQENGSSDEKKIEEHSINEVQNTNMDHKWRREIRDEYLIEKLFNLEANQTVVDDILDEDEEELSKVANSVEEIGRQEGYFDSKSDDEDLDTPFEVEF